MNFKYAIPAAAACLLIGGTAVAGDQQKSKNRAETYGAGAAAAGRDGAVAGGATSGYAANQDRQARRDRRDDRRNDANNDRRAAPANSSSTYGAGAVYTDRNRSSAGVTSGASASGTGRQSTGTTVDAYGETTRQGSSADIYGDSTAESGRRN